MKTGFKNIARVYAIIALIAVLVAIVFFIKWAECEKKLKEQQPILIAVENKKDLATPCELNKSLCEY